MNSSSLLGILQMGEVNVGISEKSSPKAKGETIILPSYNTSQHMPQRSNTILQKDFSAILIATLFRIVSIETTFN